MNNSQLKYARERLEQAARIKRDKTGRYHGYNKEKKAELYKSGDFSVVENGGNYAIKCLGEEEYLAEKAVAYDAVEVQYRAALDQLMLGDNEKALELISNFIGE